MNDQGQLKHKIAKFCAWRERCIAEVEEKLMQLGATAKQRADIIKWLKEENYISNERFALAFVHGKFTNNKWGKIKLQYELRSRKVDNETITMSLNSIDDDLYLACAVELAEKKWKEKKGDDPFTRKQKTAAYLAGKGFETDLALKALENISTV